jgi:hypothetical protein
MNANTANHFMKDYSNECMKDYAMAKYIITSHLSCNDVVELLLINEAIVVGISSFKHFFQLLLRNCLA